MFSFVSRYEVKLKNMPLKKIRILRSPLFIKKTICLIQNKPHFMKRGHHDRVEGERETELKRKKCSAMGNDDSYFSYGKYLPIYFKPNINVNILNKQKHTRGNNRVLFFMLTKNYQDSPCIFLNIVLQKAGCKGCCIFNFSVNYGLSIVVNLVLKTQLRK